MKNNLQVHKNHRERMKETFAEHGFSVFTDVQKLEFLLFFAIPQKDVNPIAHNLLNEFGSLSKVLNADYEALTKVDGVGKHTAMLIKTCQSFGIEMNRITNYSYIKNALMARQHCFSHLRYSDVEEFYVICLTNTNKVLISKKINSGDASRVRVDINQITRLAFNQNAAKIIIAHNHPCGTLKFSDEDAHLTNSVICSCLLNNLDFVDHILVTPESAIALSELHGIGFLKDMALKKLNIKQPHRDPFAPYEEYVVSEPIADESYFEREYGHLFTTPLSIENFLKLSK